MSSPLDLWVEKFWAALRNTDEYSAVDLVKQALEEGVPPEQVLMEIIVPAQRRVGARWAANRLSVAQEHAATAISDRAVAALSVHPAARITPRLGRVTVACVDGEWHALPARLVAEVLRLRGWHVDFLGAHVPSPHLISHLHSTGPDAVALSCSIPTRLPTAHAAITACQSTGVPVLAGGPGFGPDGRYAVTLGADAWAGSARDAAERLAGDWPPSPASPLPVGEEWLPHLADQEYTMVSRTRSQLVTDALAALPERFPSMGDYSEIQREHAAEDLAHVTDFLATALYVDDAELFEGFLTWTAEILSARNVPVHSLSAALEVMAESLRDFPRASALITGGLRALARQHTPQYPGTHT